VTPTTRLRNPMRALFALLALSLGVVAIAPGAHAPSSTPVGTTVAPGGLPNGGTLTLAVGSSTGQLTWTKPDGSTETQGIFNKRDLTGSPKDNCFLALQPAALLVTFGANGTNVPGFVPDSIGVYGGGSGSTARGTACSRIDAPSEVLTLSLAGDLSGYAAWQAGLDMEVKNSARILATLKLNGVVQGYAELQSGSSVGLPASHAGVTPFVCNAVSDSGPDSGPNDNCRWPITGMVFNSMDLTMLAGSASLEGGGDYTPSVGHESTFDLTQVTGSLDCTPGSTSSFQPTGNGTTTVGVTGSRLGNTDGGTCSPIYYYLATDTTHLHFLKSASAQAVAFAFDATWTEPITTYPIPPTHAIFDDDPSGTTQNLSLCQGTPVYNSSGQLTGITGTVPDMVAGAPGVQYACIYDEHLHYDSATTETVTQSIYLQGDFNGFR